MERYVRNGAEALEFFSKQDAQAMQYSLIIKSLLATCLNHLQQRELNERLARMKASSELFGLQVGTYSPLPGLDLDGTQDHRPFEINPSNSGSDPSLLLNGFSTPDWEDFDIGAFGELSTDGSHDIYGSLNLLPMFDNF